MRYNSQESQEIPLTSDQENIHPVQKRFSPVRGKLQRRTNVLREITESVREVYKEERKTREMNENELDMLFSTLPNSPRKGRKTREM